MRNSTTWFQLGIVGDAIEPSSAGLFLWRQQQPGCTLEQLEVRMRMNRRTVSYRLTLAGLALLAAACASESPSERSADALATALTPQQAPGYYVEQAHKYFDTLDTSADPEIADFVRRAQDFWPSWLEASMDAGPDYFARGCGWTQPE